MKTPPACGVWNSAAAAPCLVWISKPSGESGHSLAEDAFAASSPLQLVLQ